MKRRLSKLELRYQACRKIKQVLLDYFYSKEVQSGSAVLRYEVNERIRRETLKLNGLELQYKATKKEELF